MGAKGGESVRPEALRKELNVTADHERLFRRMLEMAARAGVLAEADDAFGVLSGSGDPWPAELPEDPEDFAERMAELYPHGLTEIGLFRRSGGALPDVLRGRPILSPSSSAAASPPRPTSTCGRRWRERRTRC